MLENVDVVIGSIANDRMFYVLDNLFLGNITDTALVNSLSALQLQIGLFPDDSDPAGLSEM